MKKLRLLSIFIAVIIIFSLVPMSAANKTVFRTSASEDNYVQFTISGNTLTVEGKIVSEDLASIWMRSKEITKLNEYSKIIDAKSGEYFRETLSLAGISEPTNITLYTRKSTDEANRFWGFIWKDVVVEPSASGYRFVTSSIEAHNLDMYNHWVNPADELGVTSDKVKAVSDEICKGLTNNHDKVFAIYKWVTENLYYDYDYFYGKRDLIHYKADDVLDCHLTVCAGYADLLKELLWAQGIPAMEVDTYAAGISVEDFGTAAPGATESNHAHVEAWVDGHWMIMDATWDSNNKYEDGIFITKAPSDYKYFDISIDTFSYDHKILVRDSAAPKDTPASWAQPEVISALANDLVPGELQHDYASDISRHDFCTLLMSAICHYEGVDTIEELLKLKGITLKASPFVDDKGLAVIAANLLGIVNGTDATHFSPDANIKRQEAATMIRRAATVLGLHEGTEIAKFADTAKLPAWALDGINFTSSLVSDHGARVMGGVGNNNFDPSGTFTVQQSILALYRLFDTHQ